MVETREQRRVRFLDIGRMWANTVVQNMGLKPGARSDREYEAAKARIDKLGLNTTVYEGAIKTLAAYVGL